MFRAGTDQLERLWSLYSWRCAKPDWTLSWVTSLIIPQVLCDFVSWALLGLYHLHPHVHPRQQRELPHGTQNPLFEYKAEWGEEDPYSSCNESSAENCSFPNLILLFTFFMTNTREHRVQQAEFIHSPSIMKAPSETVSSRTATPLKAALTFEDHPLQEWRVIQPASCLTTTHPSWASVSLLEQGSDYWVCSVPAVEQHPWSDRLWESDPLLWVLGHNWAPFGCKQLKQDWSHKPAGRGVSNLAGIRRKTHPSATALHIS